MPRMLIVSPHFPPVNAPDMHRVRMSLPHFVEAGWEVVILTVDDPEPLAPVEPELLETIPSKVEIVRVPVWPLRWTARFGLRNLGWRALFSLARAGSLLLRQRRFDIVYFSTTQFIVLPLGRIWHRRFRVPYVIDLQDPWLSDFYSRTGTPAPGGWKYRWAWLSARLLEGWTLRRCAHLIAVSQSYIDTLSARYSWFDRNQATHLTFGSPDGDSVHVQRRMRTQAPLIPPSSGLRLAYAGRLGPDMIPALEILFAAVAHLRHSGHRVELYFFGTSYAAAGTGTPTTRELAARFQISDVVHESTARIGYLDSLRLLQEADLNLILGSTDLAYSPSKLYPVLQAGRPAMAIAPLGSVLGERIQKLGGAFLASFDPAKPEECERTVVSALSNALSTKNSLLFSPLDRPIFNRNYSAKAIADKQLDVFEKVSQKDLVGAIS